MEQTQTPVPRATRGFTLLELMIAVGIVAILAAVAYPTYTGYIRTARYSDAAVALNELAQAMERYYSANGSYLGAVVGTAGEGETQVYPSQSPESYYTLSITGQAATQYEIKATPAGAMAGDTHCGVFSLNQAGIKCIRDGAKCNTASAAADRDLVAACW